MVDRGRANTRPIVLRPISFYGAKKKISLQLIRARHHPNK
jgi:hypothetical protein